MSIKYYLYVSDTKVEMLFSQIPRAFLSGLAGELKVNLGVVSTTLKQGADPETTFAKLTAVVRYLEQNESVGTIDKPASYFKGQLPVVWGPYGVRMLVPITEASPFVYFGGQTQHTILGLGGSSQHVIGGAKGSSSSTDSASVTPVLAARLYDGLDMPDSLYKGQGTEYLALAVDVANAQLKGTHEEVEFFARRLAFYPKGNHSGHRQDMNILLGTPLYVALAA